MQLLNYIASNNDPGVYFFKQFSPMPVALTKQVH